MTTKRPSNPRLVPPGTINPRVLSIGNGRPSVLFSTGSRAGLSTGEPIGAKRHIDRTGDTPSSSQPRVEPSGGPKGQMLRDMVTSSLDLLIEMHGLTFVLQCLADVTNERSCERQLGGSVIESGAWRRVTAAIQSAKSRAKGDRL